MHSILPNPDYDPNDNTTSSEAIFLLEGEVRSSTARVANDIAIIEGRDVTNTLRKVLWVYHDLDVYTDRFGSTLFGSSDRSIDTSKPIVTPKKFLKKATLPDDGQRTQVSLNIGISTKDIIEYHTERDAIDFDTFMTGAFAYYGLLATHLYNGEDIYLRKLFSKKLERFVVPE